MLLAAAVAVHLKMVSERPSVERQALLDAGEQVPMEVASVTLELVSLMDVAVPREASEATPWTRLACLVREMELVRLLRVPEAAQAVVVVVMAKACTNREYPLVPSTLLPKVSM